MTFGLDAKFAYASSGDVIDIATHKVVGQLKDELGRPIYSENYWTSLSTTDMRSASPISSPTASGTIRQPRKWAWGPT